LLARSLLRRPGEGEGEGRTETRGIVLYLTPVYETETGGNYQRLAGVNTRRILLSADYRARDAASSGIAKTGTRS
jgi:hypothetical protein